MPNLKRWLASNNSGSPVINEDTGQAIGIHTHGGCSKGGGSNLGTGSNHAGLQSALANPLGVCIPPCPADLDDNGTVGIGDLLALFDLWGPCPGPPGCPGDLNVDGTVGVGDMLIMFANWGPCP